MTDPARLYQFLQQQGIHFFTGVPDSLFKDFLQYLQGHCAADAHVITANEGLAVGLACGYHLSTGKVPLVYLQNSGLGNIVNPITSLADREVYGIPMLLMIGWRGRPGVKDEPQHIKMGRITIPLLEVLELPYYVLGDQEDHNLHQLQQAIDSSIANQQPTVVLVPEKIFSAYQETATTSTYVLCREQVIADIINALKGDETVVCTTGKIGREFYSQNKLANEKITRHFLSVGGMGHANHIAMGIANTREGKTIVLDGDGALLMHLGALPTLAHHLQGNFTHIVLNNGSHESVGGQPTVALHADLCAMAKGAGYPTTYCIDSEQAFNVWLKDGLPAPGISFVEIRTNTLSRADLERPAGSANEWKNSLMQAFQKNS